MLVLCRATCSDGGEGELMLCVVRFVSETCNVVIFIGVRISSIMGTPFLLIMYVWVVPWMATTTLVARMVVRWKHGAWA